MRSQCLKQPGPLNQKAGDLFEWLAAHHVSVRVEHPESIDSAGLAKADIPEP